MLFYFDELRGRPGARGCRRGQRQSEFPRRLKAIVATLDCPTFDVSVGIEDVRPADWVEDVYQPDILGKPKTIYKQPGYRFSDSDF